MFTPTPPLFAQQIPNIPAPFAFVKLSEPQPMQPLQEVGPLHLLWTPWTNSKIHVFPRWRSWLGLPTLFRKLTSPTTNHWDESPFHCDNHCTIPDVYLPYCDIDHCDTPTSHCDTPTFHCDTPTAFLSPEY